MRTPITALRSKLKPIAATLIAATLLSGCSIKRIPPKHLRSKAGFEASEVQLSKALERDDKEFSFLLGELDDAQAETNKTKIKRRNHYELDESMSIEVAISNKGYTRFSIEDERITDVFVYPQEEVAVQIHNQGYLIIAPNSEDTDSAGSTPREKLYVTITGEDGTVQDIYLKFHEKNPEPVKLIKPNQTTN
jgi:hypothetical protein